MPALVEPALFEAAQVQLDENRKRKGKSKQRPALAAAGTDSLPLLWLCLF